MRKLAFVAAVFVCFALSNLASAQQGDAYLGFGTLLSPGSAECGATASAIFTCPEKGGLYVNLGGDVIFHRRMGLAFDAAWRGSQGQYGGTGGQPYRPILFDFNGVYQPKLNKKAGLELVAGIGWQSTRFYGYTPTSNCVYFGACYQSSNHFLIDIGGGIRYYVRGHLFVRPEVRYYEVFNNTVDFTSGSVIRVGASIGYTIGPD